MTHVHVIAWEVSQASLNPDYNQVFEAAKTVMKKTHTKYCDNLEPCPNKGPICPEIIVNPRA
jgi:hypothetical protein